MDDALLSPSLERPLFSQLTKQEKSVSKQKNAIAGMLDNK